MDIVASGVIVHFRSVVSIHFSNWGCKLEIEVGFELTFSKGCDREMVSSCQLAVYSKITSNIDNSFELATVGYPKGCGFQIIRCTSH